MPITTTMRTSTPSAPFAVPNLRRKIVSITAQNAAGLPTTDDWPSFNAELTRKTSEQLQVWSDRYDRGVITLATMISVVAVLYDTTSGLIERDLSHLIADLHRDLTQALRKTS
jgi:hypothetical protein